MTVMAECEKCGHKWEIELKPRETIQCPNCKGIFDMRIVLNDPQNREFVEWLNSQPKEIKNNKKEISITVSQNDVQTAYNKLKNRIAELEEENAELKGIKDVATLIRANNDTVTTLMQLNNMLVSKSQQLTKAKEIIKDFLLMAKVEHLKDRYETVDEAEQFLNSEVEK